MLTLNKEEKKVIEKVVNSMMNTCGVYAGCYNAKLGNENFVRGIGAAMEYLGYLAGDEFGVKVATTFTENMKNSKKGLDNSL